ncbi:hypothetical protein ACLOJK_019954 [Asimina triloba]
MQVEMGEVSIVSLPIFGGFVFEMAREEAFFKSSRCDGAEMTTDRGLRCKLFAYGIFVKSNERDYAATIRRLRLLSLPLSCLGSGSGSPPISLPLYCHCSDSNSDSGFAGGRHFHARLLHEEDDGGSGHDLLSACETMGSTTTIYTDETDTVTMNQMKVDKFLFDERLVEIGAPMATANILELLH